MAQKASKSPVGGGALIAIAAVLGSIIGLFAGEPSKGFVVGLVAGIGMSVAIWLLDMRQ